MAEDTKVLLSAAEDTRARAQLAQGLSFLRARETLTGLSGATLQSSLADAIARLDSAAKEGVGALEDAPAPYLAQASGVGLGELQRIQAIRTALLGTDGLIARLRGD